MRIWIVAALPLLAGCAMAAGYQPAPPGIPEAVNAHCNVLGAQAGANDIAVRSQCLNYWRLTGAVPGAATAMR